MRRRKEREGSGFNVWRSYSDMMAGILLLFVLIMCVSLFQAQVSYEDSIRERDEKLYLQEEYTKQIMEQEDILSTKDDTILSQDQKLKAQKEQLDSLAEELAQKEALLEEQGLTLADQQKALADKTEQLATQQERIDKIIGVKADVIEALRQEFAANNINVVIDETNGALVMDSSVLFEYDETELTEEGQQVLGSVLPIYCSVLMQEEYFPYLAEIIIDGYTDSSGGYAYNLSLSQRRSLAVADYLLNLSSGFLSYENEQNLREHLTVNGHSSSNLVLDENGNEDPVASRRVEVKFRLKDEEMIDELRAILDT